MRKGIAKIEWLLSKKWIPPVIPINERVPGNAYYPMIVFEGQYDQPIWTGQVCNVPTWSAVIYNEMVNKKESIATVSYLMDSAPQELIQVGARFTLYGHTKIASGTVFSICSE